MRARLLPALALLTTAPAALAQLAVNEIDVATPGGWRVLRTPVGIFRQAPGSTVQEPTAFAFNSTAGGARCVAVDPKNPKHWLVGTVGSPQDARVFLLTDDGDQVLQAEGLSLAGARIEDIEFSSDTNNDRVLAAFGGAGGQEGAWLSENGGKTWEPVEGTKDYALTEIEVDPFDPNRVVACDAFGFTAFSTDGGKSFGPKATLTPFLGTIRFLEASVHTPGRLYLSDSSTGFWRSDDFGQTWLSLFGTGFAEKAFAENPSVPDNLYVIDDLDRYYLSANGGDSWSQENASFVNTLLFDIDMDPATGSLLIGSDALGLSQLTAPVVALGQATQGSGGFRPRIYNGGILGSGSLVFSVRGDRLVGGAPVYGVLSANEVAVPLFGGTLHVGGPYPIQFLTQASGPLGAPGAGEFERVLPVPANPAITGATFLTQYVAFDPGASDPSQFVLAGGLRLVGQ